MSDQIVRGLALGNNVRVFVGKTTQLVAQAQAIHQTHPAATAALGRVMSIASVMASGFKDERETLKIDIRGNGPLKSILVNANNKGEIRGLVGNPEAHAVNDLGKLDVGGILGQGTLMVSNEFNGNTVFQSQVALQTGEIGDDFAYYFFQSEQLPSAVSVGVLVGEEGQVISAGVILIQVLPSATETDIKAVEHVLAGLKPVSTIMGEMEAKEVALALFADMEILSEGPVTYKCSCSLEQMRDALSTLDVKDLEEMIHEDHGAELECHYCASKYKFSQEDLQALIDAKQ